MAKLNQFQDWSELNPCLLDKIARHVHSIKDYFAIRAVCKAWNLKLSKHLGPWLVLACEEDLDHLKVPYWRMPELKNTMLRGSSYGWLISVGTDGALQVSNPFTNSNFNLPPMSTFPEVICYHPEKEKKEYVIKDVGRVEGNTTYYTASRIHMQKSYLEKVILSCSPEHDKEFMAVAIYGEYCRLAFCMSGDKKWTDIPIMKINCHWKHETYFSDYYASKSLIFSEDLGTHQKVNIYYEDVICHEGKIYALDFDACLDEFDMKTLRAMNTVPPPCDLSIPYASENKKYIVFNPDGDLLLVIRRLEFFPRHKICNGEEEDDCYRTCGFEIYKLNKSEKQWFRDSNLGDYVLMVGFNSSTWTLPFLDDEENWVKDCIYYTDNMVDSHYTQVFGGHDVGIFSFKDGKINPLFPRLDYICPPPIWVSHP